jgi:hypothetical protein
VDAPPRRRTGTWLVRQYHQGIEPWHAQVGADLADGASESDVEWWWNLSPHARARWVKAYVKESAALFVRAQHEGLNIEAAGDYIKHHLPHFLAVRFDPLYRDEDRPLPFCLLKRVSRYRASLVGPLRKEAHREQEAASSFNAWIRAVIRDGKLPPTPTHAAMHLPASGPTRGSRRRHTT